MSVDLIAKADRGEFQQLFIDELNWLAPDGRRPVSVTAEDGRPIEARNVASYNGLSIWVCDERPGSVLEAELDRLIAKTSTDRLVIFNDVTEQVWRWPVRRTKTNSVSSRLTSHKHRKGDPDPKFAARLDIIRMPFDVVLDANAVLSKVRHAFDVEAQNESKRASKLMANMYAAVEKAYPSSIDAKRRDHEISVTLARILFLIFGDDTEMWQTDAFRNVIQHETREDGSDLGPGLNHLFEFLNTAQPAKSLTGRQGFKYVNGGIFQEPISLPPLNKEFRDAILQACAVDWSGISPAIFGSMFQSVRDADTRRALGEHYTSEENILKTLNPLFLDELRADLAAALARDTPQKRINALNKLWDRLGAIRFLDPACGCGNFIIVAYRELRDIELQLMESLHDLRDFNQLSLDAKADLKVTLDHFHGIEIDEWPAKIAETAMFMIDRQCDLKLKERFGEAPERLPLQREAKIEVGNALRLKWSRILAPSAHVVVAGNPPFHGPKERTKEQTEDLRAVWGADYDGFLDYVTGWHAKVLSYLEGLGATWAFVSTNSISQGQAVPTLWGAILRRGWRVKFAHRTFPWTSEASGGAAVHCVIVGFTRSADGSATLFDHRDHESPWRAAPLINAYLVDGPNVLVKKRMRPLAEDLPEVLAGSKAVDWGYLTVEKQDFQQVFSDPIARKYVRPFKGGEELINGLDRWCLWLVDADPHELQQSSVLRVRLAEVRRRRLESPKAATRKGAATPHLFEERRQPSDTYLGIPQTFSENRLYATVARVPSDVIASIKLFTSPDPDGFLFGVVSSAMFLTWQKTVGGRLKSDPSFTNTIVWNNLPMPAVIDRKHIIEAGAGVLRARERQPGSSLAQQYDPRSMASELTRAHQELDRVIDMAFGASRRCSTELERQELLFSRFAELEFSGGLA